MALGPFPSELVHDSQFEAMVAFLCERPDMFVGRTDYWQVCAYLLGFDAARNGGPLIGLQPWLVLKAGEGNNLAWPWLAHQLISRDAAHADRSEDEQDIRSLGRLLAEFFEYRRANGLTKVFHEYAKWVRRRSWYTGPLKG